MKTLRLIILVSIVATMSIICTNASENPESKESKSTVSGVKSSNSNNALLYVGAVNSGITSNWLSTEELVESYDETKKGGFDEVVNELVMNELKKSTAIQATSCPETLRSQLIEQVQFVNENEKMTSDLSNVDSQLLSNLANTTNSRYFLIVDQYDIKKEGYPYDNFQHVVSYTVYGFDKKAVLRSSYRFATLEIGRKNDLTKHMGKIAKQISEKLNQIK